MKKIKRTEEIKKYSFILLLIGFMLLFSYRPCPAEEITGAVAKVPYPLNNEPLTLDKQIVNITVYSTFIEVTAEYSLKNDTESPLTATIGFPLEHRGKNMESVQSFPLAMSVSRGKKGEEYFVVTKKENIRSVEGDTAWTEWYTWEVEINPRKTERFHVHYYLKMIRKDGIPNFCYQSPPPSYYTGKIGFSDITVNMPMDCSKISFATKKFYKSGSYIYCSLPKPKIQKNILSFRFDNMEQGNNLELYFSLGGFPQWEVKSSSEEGTENSANKVLDGNPLTCWMSSPHNGGIGEWLQFKPVKQSPDGSTALWTPYIKRIGIIPGNGQDLSIFYKYSQVMSAQVGLEKKEVMGKPEEEKTKRPAKKEGMILMECEADRELQVFETKQPLNCMEGDPRLTILSVYPGQNFKNLCISEILIFDREPNKTYDEQ